MFITMKNAIFFGRIELLLLLITLKSGRTMLSLCGMWRVVIFSVAADFVPVAV